MLPERSASTHQAAALLATRPDVWDMTIPWPRIYWSIEVLRRYFECGYTYLSLTLQDLPATFEGLPREIQAFRELSDRHADWLCWGPSLADLDAGKAAGRLVLGLNVQDTELVHDDLARLQTLRALGVRHMLLAYQLRNRAADGCAEPADAGLSLLGRRLVPEMNRVGIIVDVSHTGRQSSLDAIEISTQPVIFSHSGVLALCKHIRNIDDVQIRACARTGGVVGIVGIGAFLGDPDARSETLFKHIDHVVQLVGIAHVGLGTDFIADPEPIWPQIIQGKDGPWRDPYGTQIYEGIAFAPELLGELIELMLVRGYSDDNVGAVLAGNFRRVYEHIDRNGQPTVG
jgi:membrane dipeptidase